MTQNQDQHNSYGDITSSSTGCTLVNTSGSVVLPLINYDSTDAVVTVSGTFSGTLNFCATNAGLPFTSALAMTPVSGGAPVTSTTTTGSWTARVAALTVVGVYASPFVSGTATVMITSAVAGGVSTINSLSGAVTFSAGTGITIVPTGNTLTINSTGGGGGIGGSIAVDQVAYGTGANTIGGNNNFVTDPATRFLQVFGPGGGTFGGVSAPGPVLVELRVDDGSAQYNLALTDASGVAGAALLLGTDGAGPFITGLYDGTNFSTISFLTNGNLHLQSSFVSGTPLFLDLTADGNLVIAPAVGQGIAISGSTSGVAKIGVASVAGTPAQINLPIATGSAGQVLSTDGGTPQQTSWITVGGGTTLVASGNATLSVTAIPANTAQTVVTVAAIGVLATDSIEWAFNAIPGTGYNEGLYVLVYPSAGNVNFLVVNGTANAYTPGAAVLNWRVIR